MLPPKKDDLLEITKALNANDPELKDFILNYYHTDNLINNKKKKRSGNQELKKHSKFQKKKEEVAIRLTKKNINNALVRYLQSEIYLLPTIKKNAKH